jgi:hypothetical protein
LTVKGRKATYDWPAFETEAKRLIWDEGGFHPDFLQANCERIMSVWCFQYCSKALSESLILKHVKVALSAYEAEKACM